jgi:hypothetical protein
VDFTFRALSTESIEYVGILTLNGNSYGPSTFVLTPGEVSVKTNMHWQINAVGKSASIRFRLIGIGNTTKIGYEFVDITKYYKIIRPIVRRKHRCRCGQTHSAMARIIL